MTYRLDGGAIAPPPLRERIKIMKAEIQKDYRTLTRADGGKFYKVIEYKSGDRVQIPINPDGTIKWYDDSQLQKTKERGE